MARIDHPIFTSDAGIPSDAAVVRQVYTMWEAAPLVHVPPVVQNISPAPGAILATDPLSFDVVNPTKTLRRVSVTAFFQGLGIWEVVHDGTVFAPMYSERSSRTAIANGYHYLLLRSGGWPASPSITADAVNTQGDENV